MNVGTFLKEHSVISGLDLNQSQNCFPIKYLRFQNSSIGSVT